MKNQNLLFLFILLIACNSPKEKPPTISEEISAPQPISFDREYLSGLSLQSVTNKNEPNRKLFQKNLYRGLDISVYIVSSESATKFQDNYGIDEFLYLINGGARMQPKDKADQYFYTGDFFIAPKGFVGDWETIGGTAFHHELSVISTARNKNEIDPTKIQPIFIDKNKLSGIGITKVSDNPEVYLDNIYEGHEITTTLHAHASKTIDSYQPKQEQLVYIIAGALKLTDTAGTIHEYFAGDFLILPTDFVGKWESRGHHLFRYLSVTKSNWK